jgi:hypothetical protein
MLETLSGYKTYIVAAAMVLYGLSGLVLGEMDANAALTRILEGLGLSALRAGVKKS